MAATGVELHVDDAAAMALDALTAGHRQAWVVGESGSGRHTLAQKLAGARERSVVVDLLDPHEADAAIGGIYALASALPGVESRRSCFMDWPSLHLAARHVREQADDLLAVVLVPHAWETLGPATDDWDHEAQRRCSQLLHGLADSDLRIVWVTGRTFQSEQLGNESLPAPIPIRAPSNTLALLSAVDFGPYAEHSARLLKSLGKDAVPAPFALRLAVGVLALGGTLGRVTAALEYSRGNALRHLVQELVALLEQPRHVDCRKAVQRLLQARRPLPREEALRLTQVPEEHAPLVTACVAYGEPNVRVSAAVRRSLGRARFEDGEPDIHTALAEHYAKSDGAASIADTTGASTCAWLERHHHLSHSRDGVILENLPCRELFWARGRYLSIAKRDWEGAARVYEACVDRFPDDAYAWHYLAYNLEQAGLARRKVRGAYQKAVELSQAAPWGNGRYITFLLGQGETETARKAWRTALDNVDPEGQRVERDPWLAEQLHNWVARAWLEIGEVSQALAVLRSIPAQHLAASARLKELRHMVLDAVEAEALGESVYPPDFDVDRRWERPCALPELHEGDALEDWFPGRVVYASHEGVRVVYGQRSEDGEYQSRVVELDATTWKSTGFGPPERAAGYVELGVYASGARRVARFRSDIPAERPHDLPLAYFDRWREA